MNGWTKTSFINFKKHIMPPQNSNPVQRIQSYLAICSYVSIQASVSTMKNEEQARQMLTSSATGGDRGGYAYAGECFEACRTCIAGTDPSFRSKPLIHVERCLGCYHRPLVESQWREEIHGLHLTFESPPRAASRSHRAGRLPTREPSRPAR